MAEHPQAIDIDIGRELRAMTFSANGEYIVSGDGEEVRVWRTEDGRQIAKMRTKSTVSCLAVSKDGKWIAAGTLWGDVFMWDARTYEQVLLYRYGQAITAVDFSPNSKRLASASKYTVNFWDVATRRQLQHLIPHEDLVRAAKYSPQGGRIATATKEMVYVSNSNDYLLVKKIRIRLGGILSYNAGLLWLSDHLFVSSGHKIKQFDASTGSAVAEWPVRSGSCIALPVKRGDFIAHSTKSTVTLWHTSTCSQLGLIPHSQDIRSIAFSLDDRFLAIGGKDGKISIKCLPRIIDSTSLPRLHPTLQEPAIEIDDAVLESWKHNQLESTDTLLTTAIETSVNTSHHVFASRALVRARLRRWDAALEDAEKATKIQPSVIGLVAKSVAHVGKGERDKGIRTCDIALEHFHTSHVTLLLLIKAIIVFMAGEHRDAISRVDDLIATVHFNSICYAVQARAQRATCVEITTDIPEGIYVSSPWEPADGAQRLPWCDTVVRMRSSTNTALLGSTALDYLAGEMTGWEFNDFDFRSRQRLCEALLAVGRTDDAGQFLLEMVNIFGSKLYMSEANVKWVADFTHQYLSTPESDDDAASKAVQHDVATTFDSPTTTPLLKHHDAISYYSAAVALDPTEPQVFLIRRSKAQVAGGSWEAALNDANQAIRLDPLSPWGYERKHAALHKAGDYENAIKAFEAMLSKMSQSSDPEILERHRQYTNPGETRMVIRRVVQDAIRDSPRMLVNTISGRLLDKSQQAAAFESLPVFNKLISSTTTSIDHARIEHDVTHYYRYAMFSHKWEDNEPLFEQVIRMVVYQLEASHTHDKLKMFCKIVRDAGLHWAWSDTCCINKADHFVLQEALVSMFKWYQGSALTLVLLLGVRSPSRRGDLVRSIWSSRAWTFQEYHASKVVRFYNEDWMPYRNLDIPNHKESPGIIKEMEEATGISARALMALRPGLDAIREKLCLASTRQTTLVEDAAYSLFGIFSMSLPVVYGEGDQALGRLLAQLLTSSGDTSILAWTGRSGSFNSCLPANIIVFKDLPTSHIPSAITSAEMETIIARMRSSSLNLTLATKLLDRLHELPVPSFAGQRMKLPCLAFRLGPVSATRSASGRVFRAKTDALGTVEIRTTEDLSRLDPLTLVYPWIDFLLDRQPVGTVVETISEDDQGLLIGEPDPLSSPYHTTSPLLQSRTARFASRFGLPFSARPRGAASLLSPSPVSLTDKRTEALRLVARLRQPFGALLLTPTRQNVAEYRRVASESLITVRVQDDTPLNVLIASAQTIDVL
ncbi:hypothetical protein EV363DRAFT_1587463 [Boletus edulis]|nr:hypothetical protein EV363DRAFT_1587463 [Boletus edulis]